MKAILSIVCLFIVVFAHGANVTFNLSDFTASVITNRQVKLEPKSTPRSGPTNAVLSRDSLFRFSDTNGQFIVTNIQYGLYQCTLLGPYANTAFKIYVTDTNGALNASDLVVSDADAGLDTEDGLSLDLE